MGLLSRLTDERETLANAVEHAWCAAWGALGCDAATRVEDLPHMLRVLTPASPDLLLNAILRYHQPRPVTSADLAAAIAPFRAAHRPLQWWLRSGTEPQGLREGLFALGMMPWGHPVGMALPLDGWQMATETRPDVQVTPVVTPEGAVTALQTICDVFGLPPGPMRRWCINHPRFETFQATVRGAPAGALVRLRDSGVVGFYHVAVLPRYRRRGIGTAMMAYALHDAQQQGARVAALTASPMAERLYQRMGFVPCCTFEQWMPDTRLMAELNG